MAIRKSFGGTTIRKPGAYSRSKVDNSGGAAIESNDSLFLVGEAALGAPGDVEGIVEFSAAQINQLVAKYGSGPLVDAALAATRPSRTPGVGGAGRILVWKTNSSTRASYTAQNGSSDDLIKFSDVFWGAPGNNLSITIADGDTSNQKIITINKLNDTAEVLDQNPADVAISVQYTGDASSATLAIAGASKSAKTLSTTLAGDQTDGSADLSISLNNYSMKQLADFIDAQTGYSASLVTNTSAAFDSVELDPVSSVDITSASSLYRLQEELIDIVNQQSERVIAELDATPAEDLPANISGQFLTGGAQGASTNSDFSDGLSKSLAEDYNVVLPCVSRDASDDIADAQLGFTDASSTYDIDSVLAATDSHLRLRSSVQNRKEAQGMGGYRKSAKADVFAGISTLGSEFMQVAMQDVLVQDVNANLSWKQPHIFAALAAGIRLGTEVGEPLTFKRLNCNAIGHDIDPETGLEDGDFNPALDVDQAIDNGVLFAERSGSIFRIVVDNTTYGTDESFVFNRGSVVEAAQFVAKDIRGIAEDVFVGNKVSNGLADSIKSVIRSRLIELNADDVNIITGSLDAPQGFVEETFVVNVEGNTAEVQVEVKPVQGLDFVLITFTLGNIRQSA